MTQLQATFGISATRIDAMVGLMNARTSSTVKVEIEDFGNGWATLVTGKPQDVMFVIGEVAAQGEDCLIHASLRLNNRRTTQENP